MRKLHDHYFNLAKREGYRSRAAYKLIEIDERRHVLKRGDVVLDCGAAPGSWLQVTAQRVGQRGRVLGVDLLPIEPVHDRSNVILIEGDLAALDDATLRRAAGFDDAHDHARFDVVLSDMAPNTSGERSSDHHRSVRLCELVLERATTLLKPGGNLVMKVFEGERSAELLAMTRQAFEHVKGFKPKASRSESFEMYLIALGFRNATLAKGAPPEAATPHDHELPPRIKRGWDNTSL